MRLFLDVGVLLSEPRVFCIVTILESRKSKRHREFSAFYTKLRQVFSEERIREWRRKKAVATTNEKRIFVLLYKHSTEYIVRDENKLEKNYVFIKFLSFSWKKPSLPAHKHSRFSPKEALFSGIQVYLDNSTV